VRWRVGQVLLGVAGLLTLVALVRPLAPWSPGWLKAADALLLGLGVTSSALLASLRGRKLPETLALQAFLVLSVDALGQVVGARGFPVWPLMALLVAALAVAEGLPMALGVAGRPRSSRSPTRRGRSCRRSRRAQRRPSTASRRSPPPSGTSPSPSP